MILSLVAVVLQTQATCVSRPAAPVAKPWAAAAARAHAIACEKLAPHIPGFAIAVAVDGRIVWSEAFGFADVKARRAATPATQFRIGSVSKPLTATAIAQLFETGKLDIDAPVAENIRQVAKAKGKRPEEVTVTVLDRDRHGGLIAEIREIGARVFLITDGDVAGAIVAAAPRTEVDLLMGIGGTPEGVIAAAALKCLGGAMQGRLYPRNDDERRSLIEGGYDLERVLRTSDLVASDDCFFAATGITDGYLLQGVKYWPDGASTHSMVMRSRSGTLRYVASEHSFEKLERFSPIQYRP